ncbi:MAG: hypothetical protein A2896_00010 [Candidatus Nealsonbacteria bacterium RIFCSPLOWO2_01_FULL_43_32]|uniref:Uncharacterized protein n=1 Tax=Candidatus Nealsonbacteria bacterium RIFCSPLOWO2_01_FULL_43_32 TaxID=1801672 RepID=A0A1G2EF42_9BACT|nr:MAG: hypothetical protein A2896_00010 [Candidatus Nealsonbacteria bacterium RIFCSPLOWO2_01_FULL_43_32]
MQPREYSGGSGLEDALYITDSDGNLNVFSVKRDDSELWLNSNWSNPDNVWNPDNHLAFVFPRNSLYFFTRPIRDGFI